MTNLERLHQWRKQDEVREARAQLASATARFEQLAELARVHGDADAERGFTACAADSRLIADGHDDEVTAARLKSRLSRMEQAFVRDRRRLSRPCTARCGSPPRRRGTPRAPRRARRSRCARAPASDGSEPPHHHHVLDLDRHHVAGHHGLDRRRAEARS